MLCKLNVIYSSKYCTNIALLVTATGTMIFNGVIKINGAIKIRIILYFIRLT